MTVHDIINSKAEELEKFEAIHQFVDTLSIEEVDQVASTLEPCDLAWKLALLITIIEKKINQGDDTCGDQLTESASCLAKLVNSSSRSDTPLLIKLLKFRIADLNTDYMYLFNRFNYNYKIMELGNKKINLLTSLEYNFPVKYKKSLVYKIIDYLIISNYDFRKIDLIKFISNFVNENDLIIDVSPLTQQLSNMLISKQFIDRVTFMEYLKQVKTPSITHLNVGKLLDNLMENNLYVASTCYKSVKLQKLNKILGFEVDHLLISKLIVSKSLPEGTKFDQINMVLEFPEVDADDYNGCLRLVQEISNKVAV